MKVLSVSYHQPSHIVEWGTHMGKSARIFYETARHFRMGTEIHSIDLPDDVDHVEHPHQKRGHLVRGIKDVRLYQGDGVTTALGIWSKVKGTVTPLFFLDGDHEFTAVLRELKTIHENIKGASMLVHDTFYQSAESGYNIGPYLAIQEFLKSNPSTYRRLDTKLGLPGMTFLYQR